MTEQQLLDLLAGVVALATPLNSNGVNITSLDFPISETGLDSLDMLMVSIYLSDVYGVSEEDVKTMQPVTIRDIFEFMCQHKTKEPTSVEAALNDISN
jgi:acyl carrier protein